MKIDKKEVEHFAYLSRIKLTEEESNKFTPQMETIIDSVTTLDDVSTSAISGRNLKVVDFQSLREDTPEKSLPVEKALKNAPHHEGNFFKVYGSVIESVDA